MASSTEHLRDLLKVGEAAKAAIRPRAIKVFDAQIAYAFLSKAMQTLNAVVLLLDNGIKEEAQALVRVLFDTRVSFDYYTKLAQKDARAAAVLFVDSIMIEKHKQYRMSNATGSQVVDGILVKPGIEQDFARVEQRYTPEEVKLIAKHGFSKLGTEAMAKATGHGDAYQILFRNFSRNVHGRDHTETLLREGLVEPSPLYDHYLELRRRVTINEAFRLAYGLISYIDHNFDLALAPKIDAAYARWDAERDRSPEPQPDAGDDEDPET